MYVAVVILRLYFMENFGNKLNDIRHKRSLTVKQLSERARVPASLISGLQTNNRSVGENNARKIGKALELTDDALQDFVYLAINHASDKVLHQHSSYPAEVLNLVAVRLRGLGISPDQIAHCIRDPRYADTTADAALVLTDGTTALLDLTIAFRN